MPVSIPEHKIEEIRDATDIVELISGYVTLKKKGQNYFGLCPFHQEKTPSFSVNPAKQIFHCFGCQAGGNVFTFLMRHEGISFPETVKYLAQKIGVALEFDEADATASKENETLYYVNEFATGFFSKNLMSAAGQAARDYLKKRGISKEIVESFQLGYALPAWDGFIQAAKASYNDNEMLLKAGLILHKEGGHFYDRFRDRIIFPIKNLSGRVVAFGGRILTDQPNSPKYINSPETPVYEKGKVLYGLFQTRDDIRKQEKAVFVEGYMDFLSLYAGGVTNVAATLGTALTEDQARLVRRYTKHIFLMYDSDAAGLKATVRGADILVEENLDVRIVRLPEGHDPDSFVREAGKEKTLNTIEQAQSIFDYKLNAVTDLPFEQRGDGIRSLLGTLAKVADRIQRNLLLSKISQTLQVGEKVLWTELEALIRSKSEASRRESKINAKFNDLSRVGKGSILEKAVEDLVRILIHHWDMAPLIFANLKLTEIESTKMFLIMRYLNNRFKGGKPPVEEELIHHCYDVDLTSFIVREVDNPQVGDIDVEKWALDCIVTIKKEFVQEEITSLREKIKTMHRKDHELHKLLKKCMELEDYKKQISTAVS